MSKEIKIGIIIVISVIISGICLGSVLYKNKIDGTNKNTNTNQLEVQNRTTTTLFNTNTTATTKEAKKPLKTTKKKKHVNLYKLTHYGHDCKNCSGITASGYDVNNTIYYNDKTYGKVRIIAIKDLPLYSIVKINNYDGKDIIAVVLDRGVGNGIIDLLVNNENEANNLGIRKNIELEVLRSGR